MMMMMMDDRRAGPPRMGGPAPIGRSHRRSPLGKTWASGRERGRDHHNSHVQMDETATTRQQDKLRCLANRSSAPPHSSSGSAEAVTGPRHPTAAPPLDDVGEAAAEATCDERYGDAVYPARSA
jgi:hypothetical protein